MGYVRNERGMKQALDSLARIEALKDDLIADNWHELMRTHEALVLLEMCKLVTLASIEHRETSNSTIYMRSDYPDPDPGPEQAHGDGKRWMAGPGFSWQ